MGDEGTTSIFSKAKRQTDVGGERGTMTGFVSEMIVRLNFCALVVGLNQIQLVFMPQLERSTNRFALV
jgi:hypothetical protein